ARERAEETSRVAEGSIGVQPELEESLAQEQHDLCSGEDPDVGRAAELVGELTDEAVAEGMERRDRRVDVAVRDELVDPELHLLGSLVREGEREDLGPLRP